MKRALLASLLPVVIRAGRILVIELIVLPGTASFVAEHGDGILVHAFPSLRRPIVLHELRGFDHRAVEEGRYPPYIARK